MHLNSVVTSIIKFFSAYGLIGTESKRKLEPQTAEDEDDLSEQVTMSWIVNLYPHDAFYL